MLVPEQPERAGTQSDLGVPTRTMYILPQHRHTFISEQNIIAELSTIALDLQDSL